MTRRDFLRLTGFTAVVAVFAGSIRWLYGWLTQKPPDPLLVNDMHSQLNEVRIAELTKPTSLEELFGVVKSAAREKEPLCISGSRHAMGGQQFLDGGRMIDTRDMRTVIDLDTSKGLVEVEAGIEWPGLVDHLLAVQKDDPQPWTITTKQTGADKLTLGGAMSANAHGRTLNKKPMIGEIESFLLVDANGEVNRCNRSKNQELFSLAIGGYGLFGPIHSAVLTLGRRHKLQRQVEVLDIERLVAKFDDRISDGFTLGDFQFSTDEKSAEFLTKGVFSCYVPVDIETKIEAGQDSISDREWSELVLLAHTDKKRAFKLYSDFYVKSSGQIYWSDTSQIGAYPFDYHKFVDKRMGVDQAATEMITEIYVPRSRLAGFMVEAAEELRRKNCNVVYGTIRLIERDDESFLAWAKQDYACVIFNLHVIHTPEKMKEAEVAFRALIDLGIERGGSYYLTYHRWARKDQVVACYPQFVEFLKKKAQYDPNELFQSDWYRHYRAMFRAELS